MTANLDALVENAVSRTLSAAGWFVPLSVRRDVAQAVLTVVREEDEPESAGCCAKDGIDCVSCMTGRCAECPECVHYDDSRDGDDEDDAYYDPDED